MFESFKRKPQRQPERPNIGAVVDAIVNLRENRSKARRNANIGANISQRQFHGAITSRLTGNWNPTNSSMDSELVTSLTNLRGRARALVRDASYAKRAALLVKNNVIGSGIGMQAQVRSNAGELNKRLNDAIEGAWLEWSRAENCHTGGALCFRDLERMIIGQVFEAGECLLRIHRRPFGPMGVPFALELIEAERIADDMTLPFLNPTAELRMGVEVDQFHKPVAYYLRERHPNESRFRMGAERFERVPADQIIHILVRDRWPQTRGMPWMHTALRRMNDMDGYSEAEIVRARAQAVTPGAIQTPEDVDGFATRQSDGSLEMELEAGVVKRLLPGETFVPGSVTAPNPALDPFMRYMLREVAAGIGTSYESLSRDYSQSNYSSSRLALLDDRDLWKYFQAWFIGDVRERIHEQWLVATVLARKIPLLSPENFFYDPRKYMAVRYKPRGWSWVDPTKEVAAYKEAVMAGFTTVADVIADSAGGRDIEDVMEQRAQELELMASLGLTFDTSPDVYVPPEPTAPAEPKAEADDEPDDDEATTDDDSAKKPARIHSLR